MSTREQQGALARQWIESRISPHISIEKFKHYTPHEIKQVSLGQLKTSIEWYAARFSNGSACVYTSASGNGAQIVSETTQLEWHRSLDQLVATIALDIANTFAERDEEKAIESRRKADALLVFTKQETA